MSTRYSDLSQSSLHALFTHEAWQKATPEERLDALQEVSDRFAQENGIQPCVITKEEMDGFTYGYQSNSYGTNFITINSHVIDEGKFVTNVYDNEGKLTETVEENVSAPGWNLLDTTYHETEHAIQRETGQMHDTYIGPGGTDENGNQIPGDYDLYRIGPEERDAFATGQGKTIAAIMLNEAETGKADPDKDDYMASVLADSYENALSNAKEHFGDENVQETLDMVIQDRDNGVVRENPSPCYQAISQICDDYDNYLISSFESNFSKDTQNNKTDENTMTSNDDTGVTPQSQSIIDSLNALKDDIQNGFTESFGLGNSGFLGTDDGLDDDPGMSSSSFVGTQDGLDDNPGFSDNTFLGNDNDGLTTGNDNDEGISSSDNDNSLDDE